MNKAYETFGAQLSLIENKSLASLIELCLLNAPEYFYTMPASTSGKYHPAYSLGEGGLVRHTKAAVKIANCLLSLEMYKGLNKDEIIAALILHDSVKKGRQGGDWTVIEHPLQAADLLIGTARACKYEDIDQVERIASMIRSHMGQWNLDKHGFEALPKPITKEQKFVHQCDYLASKKFLIVEDLDND